jgi:hypothetical protein
MYARIAQGVPVILLAAVLLVLARCTPPNVAACIGALALFYGLQIATIVIVTIERQWDEAATEDSLKLLFSRYDWLLALVPGLWIGAIATAPVTVSPGYFVISALLGVAIRATIRRGDRLIDWGVLLREYVALLIGAGLGMALRLVLS